MPLQQLAGGDGELHDVGGHAGRVRTRSDFCAATVEGLQLEIVQCGAGNNDVIAGVAVLRFGEGLDDLC